MPDMEEEIIFRFRGDIKGDSKISDSKKDELFRLGKKETFDEFLGYVYLYSLTRDNMLTLEAKERLNQEIEEYKRHPLDETEIPEAIIKEEREYTTALAEAYGQAENMNPLPMDKISDYPKHEKHLTQQRKYYFAAEAVRRMKRM